MAKNLVIVESPAKAKTINKLLGKDYAVLASMGHVRDLPPKKLGVEVEKGFEPEYVTIKSRQKVLKELLAAAKKAEAVYLAPDPDREGEAIAWHLQEALCKSIPREQFYRVTYNEITAPAIRSAFENPGRLDMHRVNAQQARRVLDRLVGYQVSPLLWRRIRGSKSAGRVQSVALRLVCEREQEILDFKPEEYWLLGANVRKLVDPKDPFAIRLARVSDEKPEIRGEDQARTILEDLERRRLRVAKIIERELRRKAPPPFITSTLQQAASSAFGFTPSRTMRIAQRLYEGVDFGDGPVGVITYMRTDSVSIAKVAQNECRAYVASTHGDDFIPAKPNVYKSRGSAQEAHEAVRPTEVARTPGQMGSYLKAEELKLYTLIWNRYVASQMSPARIAQKTFEIDAVLESGDDSASYLFRASTSVVVFEGYMKVAGTTMAVGAGKKDDEEGETDKVPPLSEGEWLDRIDWIQEQKFTQPPARYSEASLVRALEENGVGRPSTYAQVLSTILDREYVSKEKRSLAPTELGVKVNEFLVGHLGSLFDIGFTAKMEESLDNIERGDLEWTGMLEEFYASFQKWLEESKGPAADPEALQGLLGLLGGVKEWAPPVKRGKRTYSDEKFVESIKKQDQDGKKAISMRQVEALIKLVARYRDQLPEDPAGKMDEWGLAEAYAKASAPVEPPREETIRKLDLLRPVTFDEPRTVGKRTYDDEKFSGSLREQAESGKRLSENQLRYLDRLVSKYAEQIPNFEQVAKELELSVEEAGPDNESGPILEALGKVQEWKPPVMRGKREWDDKKFFESLRDQFAGKKSLSIKQRASLKKMCVRYHEAIPDYQAVAKAFDMPLHPKKKAAAKKATKKATEKAPAVSTGKSPDG